MPPADQQRLGELLVEEGVILHEEIVRAISDGGVKGTALAAALEAAPHARRADLAGFLAADFRIPTISDLRKVDFSAESAKLVPEATCRKHALVPLTKVGNILFVAKPNFFNRAALLELRLTTRLKIKVLQADEAQVLAAIEKVYKGKSGDLPAPKDDRKHDTVAIRATPPAVEEEAVFEAIPLISPEERAAQQTPPKPADAEELVEILSPVRVAGHEYLAAAREPFARLCVEFDEIHNGGKILMAPRVA